MTELVERDDRSATVNAEQRAHIEPWLHGDETCEAFVAAAIQAEIAWRQMTQSAADSPQD